MAAVDLEYNKGFQIYNANGTPFHDLVLHKCTYETVVMSLGDKISGILYYKDNALDVKMTEYIIYKGVKYTLVNPPTILKEGLVSDNSELKGMTKYSFTFYHPMYVLNNFSFNDVAVSSDQNKYLSQNKTFSWIGTLVDFVAKLNKNLEDTQWMVTIGNVTQEEQTKLSEVLSFDKNTIAEALKRGYETWEVPYVVDSIQKGEYFYINDKNQKIDYYDDGKRFVVQYGLPTTEITVKDDNGFETPFVFKMGQGVGLKNNSRNPKNNKIITRIAGYGSEDNIPYGYPQIRYYGGTVQYPLYYGIVGGQRVQLIKHPFTRNHLMPSVYCQAVYNKVNPKLSDGSNNPNYNPNIELVDYYDADSTYANPIKSGSPSYEIHEFGDIKPELGEKTIISAVPVSQQETQSDYKQKSDFLQDILNRISATEIEDEKVCLKTLYDKVVAGLSYYAQKGEEGGREYWYRISVTSDGYYQYVSYESGNYNFTATVLKNDSSAPTPDWDDTMDDDGNYLQSYFKITLPILSFDLYACAAITQEMKINMRSGACIGCTFPVQVDWDDYKRNFYNSDGEFAPDGEQRDYTKYPDSSSGQITVMVKKELETFGTLMPNQYQQPTTGDKFVILGISLPESYITNAEQRLDADMKQYMRDNNVYYYEYPLKFDEHFLISNESILSQMKPNVVVRFDYAGETHALYIKQMSVKYNESPLPKYDITLTDDIEIVLNQIGQVTDEVSKLRLGLGENGIGGGNGQEYLRKDIDDTARGTIRLIKGMQVGERFVTGLLGEGGVFREDSDGTTYLETDKLYVRMKAYFDTVEVKHYLHTGGNRIASQASGIVCSRVEMIDANNNLAMDVADAVLFRCFFKANDGDKTIRNDFMIGDLAFCRETNVDVSSVNLHGYWRLVVGRNGNDSLTDNKEAWIDLSNRASETLTIGGRDYTCNGYQNGSDAPIAQDDIIQLGNIADKDRQGAIVEYVGGEDAPSYQIFQGVGEDLPYPYTLEDKNYVGLGYSSQTGHAYMNVYGDVFIGAKPDTVTGESPTYIKYVQEDSETGEPKLSIKAEVEFIHSDGQGGSTSTTMDDFVKSVEDSFKDIQDQIDGEIDTWYYEGVPTLLNLPASEWNTDELKKEHIGDLYYDKENGDAYRFIFDTSVEPNEYKWIQLHDDAISEALRLAADAKDTADRKRRVFLSQPTPPYDEGDIWVNATYPENSDSTDAAHNRYYNDVLCAKKAVPRTEDGKEITTFSITDWELASKYTDDTKFDGYINQILNGTGASGDSAIVASAIKAIKNALNEGTVIDGGLVLTSLISLRSNNKTWAGISGQYDATAKGYGIAAWYGGAMVDKEVATTDTDYAKSLFRFDGSGYLASGNITWDGQGRVAIKDITTLVGGNDTDILNALTTFNNAFHFTTQQGTSTILNINPQYAFSHLEIYDAKGNHSVATTDYVNDNFVTKDFFESLFELYNDNTKINTNTDISKYDKSKLNIKAMFGFWTEKYISALGKGDDGGGSVISGYLSQLLDVNITSPQVGQALVYNGTKWVNQTIQTGGIDFNDMKLLTVKVGTNTTPVIEYKGETAKTLTFDAVANSGITVSGDTGGTITIGYTLPKATNDILGGVKVGNTLSISDGVLNLPAISNLVAGTYRSVTVDVYGRVTAGTNPTTLEGYGITDAKIANGVITLGNDTITPLTDAKIKSDYTWWGQQLQTTNNKTEVKGTLTNVKGIRINDTENKDGEKHGWIDFHYAASQSFTSNIYEGDSGRLVINEALHVIRNGNVGIGTNAPSYKLDVNGNGRFVSGVELMHANTIKARLWSDNEGGNLRLVSGERWVNVREGWVGHYWEMDSFDGDLRFYNYTDMDGGTLKNVRFTTEGQVVAPSVNTNKLYLYKPNSDDTGAIYLEYIRSGSDKGVHLAGDGLWVDGFVSALGTQSSGGQDYFNADLMWQELGTTSSAKLIPQSHLNLSGYALISGVTKTLTIKNSSGNVLGTYDGTQEKTITISGVSGNYLPLTGGTLSGNVDLKYTSIDATKNGNNVSSTQYPSSFSILDSGGRIITKTESVVEPESNSNGGRIGWYSYVRQYDSTHNTNSNYLAQRGIKYMLSKSLVGTWTIDDAPAFRTALGINLDNLVTTNTTQTISGAKTFSSLLTASANVSIGGQLLVGASSADYRMHVKGGIVCEYDGTYKGSFRAMRGNFVGAFGVNGSGHTVFTAMSSDGTSATNYIDIAPYNAIDKYVLFPYNVKVGYANNTATDGAYVKIGGVYLIYDQTNNAIRVSGSSSLSDNTNPANIYAVGGVSALGSQSSGGQDYFNADLMWQELGGSASNKVISNTHLSLGTLTINDGNNTQTWTPTSGNTTITISSGFDINAGDKRYLKLVGGDISGTVNFKYGDDAKLVLRADGEGGNIRIVSPNSRVDEDGNQRFWEIDSYNGNLRFYTRNSGQTWVNFGTDGNISTSAQGVLASASDVVTAIGTSDNNLTWTKNGTTNSITVPYATSAGDSAKLGGKNLVTKNLNKPWDRVMFIDDVGGMEVGSWFDFHYNNNGTSDYSVRLKVAGDNKNTVTLPSTTGTLALTSDNVASASKLKDSHSLWGNSFNGTQDIFGNIEIRLNNKPKVRLYANNEGGNIRIYSPDSYTINNEGETNHFWEIDSYNSSFRLYNYNSSNAYNGLSLSRDLDFSGVRHMQISGSLTCGSGENTYVQIGGAKLIWDGSALKCDKDFYSTGAVSALGSNTSGGSGSGIDANWLKTNNVQIKRLGINVAPSEPYQLNVQGASNFTGAVAINNALTVNSSVSAVGGFSTSQGSISAAHNITAGGRGLIQERLTVGQSSVNNSYRLYVNGTSYFNDRVTMNNGCSCYGYLRLYNTSVSESHASFGLAKISGTEWVRLVGSDADFALYNDGDMWVTGYATLRGGYGSSDIRLKNIVNYVECKIDSIARAPIFDFTWKDKPQKGTHLGSSAQYWQNHFGSAITTSSDGYLAMDYGAVALASAVITARKVVDHELRVKQLEERIAELENEIKELKAA